MSATKAILGKWRITETDLWGAEYLDALGPAFIEFRPDGLGDISVGAMQGGLDCSYGDAEVDFTWRGDDDGTDVSGAGDAELEDDGTLSGEIRYHLGDEARFRAKRWP